MYILLAQNILLILENVVIHYLYVQSQNRRPCWFSFYIHIVSPTSFFSAIELKKKMMFCEKWPIVCWAKTVYHPFDGPFTILWDWTNVQYARSKFQVMNFKVYSVRCGDSTAPEPIENMTFARLLSYYLPLWAIKRACDRPCGLFASSTL